MEPNVQVITLRYALYGPEFDICKSIPDEVIDSAEGADEIVGALLKRGTLAIVKEVQKEFMALLSLKQGENKGFENFEQMLQAQVPKFELSLHKAPFSRSTNRFLAIT